MPATTPRPAVLAALLSLLLLVNHAHAQPGGPVLVSVAPVVRKDVLAGQSFVGTVQPKRASTVGSAIDERVVQFDVNQGDRVSQGQVLAMLRTDTVRIQLEAARIELEFRQKELEELENGTRSEEISQGQARVKAAQSRQDLAEVQRSRVMNLRQTRAVSAEEVDQSIAETQQADAALKEAQAALDLMLAGPRAEALARARIRVRLQEQEIMTVEDLLEKHTIRAPFDSYVITEHVEIGQWVAKGQAIVDLVELDRVEITVPVLEDFVRYLDIGTPGRVDVDAIPDQTFTGHVTHVVPQADLRSRSFPVEVEVQNQRKGDTVLLKSGMFARVTLPVGARKQAMLVDKDAVVLGGPTPVVFVVVPGADSSTPATARPVNVALGVTDQGLIEVIGSVKEGDKVVVQGNERLRPGQEVTITAEYEAGARRGGPIDATP